MKTVLTAVLVFGAWTTVYAQQPPVLRFNDLFLPSGATVRLDVSALPVDAQDLQLGQAFSANQFAIAQTPRYEVALDPAVSPNSRVQQLGNRVLVRNKRDGRVYAFVARYTTLVGNRDQYLDAHFEVGAEGATEHGQILFPIYSADYAAIEQVDKDKLRALWLGSAQPLLLEFTNGLDFPVALTAVTVQQGSSNPWTNPPTAVLGCGPKAVERLAIAPKQKGCVTATLQSDLFRALSLSAAQGDDSGADAVVDVVVDYEIAGGVQRSTPAKIRIRFRPNSWHLIFAILIGAAVGALIPALNAAKRRRQLWIRRAVVAGVTAVIVESACVLLERAGSEVTLVGVPISPSQMLPALFVGLVAGFTGPYLLKKYTEEAKG